MKKYITLFLLLIVIHFKDGFILRVEWADSYSIVERWNKTFYCVCNSDWDVKQKISIPTENVLYIERK